MASMRSLPQAVFNSQLYRKVLSLWYEDLSSTGPVPPMTLLQKWFGMSPEAQRQAFDKECHSLCMDALNILSPERWPLPAFESFDADRAAAGQLSAPFASAIASGAGKGPEPLDIYHVGLSFFLLLDQMPRNIFRDDTGKKLVFNHYDRLARALAHTIVLGPGSKPTPAGTPDIKGLDMDPEYRYHASRRMWFMIPLEHSENIADHDEWTKRYEDLQSGLEEAGTPEADKFMESLADAESRHRVIIEKFGRYPHRNGALGRTATKEEKEFLAGGGDTFSRG